LQVQLMTACGKCHNAAASLELSSLLAFWVVVAAVIAAAARGPVVASWPTNPFGRGPDDAICRNETNGPRASEVKDVLVRTSLDHRVLKNEVRLLQSQVKQLTHTALRERKERKKLREAFELLKEMYQIQGDTLTRLDRQFSKMQAPSDMLARPVWNQAFFGRRTIAASPMPTQQFSLVIRTVDLYRTYWPSVPVPSALKSKLQVRSHGFHRLTYKSALDFVPASDQNQANLSQQHTFCLLLHSADPLESIRCHRWPRAQSYPPTVQPMGGRAQCLLPYLLQSTTTTVWGSRPRQPQCTAATATVTVSFH
jgi:hypothetical protein